MDAERLANLRAAVELRTADLHAVPDAPAVLLLHAAREEIARPAGVEPQAEMQVVDAELWQRIHEFLTDRPLLDFPSTSRCPGAGELRYIYDAPVDAQRAAGLLTQRFVTKPPADEHDHERAHRLRCAQGIAQVQRYRPRRGAEWIHDFWTGDYGGPRS